MKNLKKAVVLAGVIAVTAVAPEAFAVVAAPDTAATVTYLETNGPIVIAAIGGTMLTLAAVAVLFKWIKASVFG